MNALALAPRETMMRVRDLDHAVDLFEGELARRGWTPATRQKYREVLYPFVEFCGELPPWEVTRDHCRRFLDRWVNAAPATLALYISILTRFFAFLHEEAIIPHNPMERIKRPPLKRPDELEVTSVTAEDVEALFAAIRTWPEMLCLSLLTYLGPRRSAAAQVRRGDVDLERGMIRFLEKGGKVIVKPLPEELVSILRAAEAQGVWQSPRDYLIPNRRPSTTNQRKRSNKIIYALVETLAEHAGVSVHPHALRAAFAVQFDEQHPDQLIALKELMGHARIETTLVYLRRKNRARAMEQVRDLSWGSRGAFPERETPGRRPDEDVPVLDQTTSLSESALQLRPSADVPPTGFEPVFEEESLPEALRLKLASLRARSSRERA